MRDGARDAPRALWAAALVVALVATAGSLRFSGVGPLDWRGLGLFPCELCWYQRILMYPIPVLIVVGLLRRDPFLGAYVLPLAVAGVPVAAYHVLLQLRPDVEVGQCFVGSCSLVDYLFLDRFTIPQLSLLAFVLVTVLGAAATLLERERAAREA